MLLRNAAGYGIECEWWVVKELNRQIFAPEVLVLDDVDDAPPIRQVATRYWLTP